MFLVSRAFALLFCRNSDMLASHSPQPAIYRTVLKKEIVLPPIAIASRIARGFRRRGSASKLSRGVDPPPGSKESTVKLTS